MLSAPVPWWHPSHRLLSFLNKSFLGGFPKAAALQVLLQYGSVPWSSSFRSRLFQHKAPLAAAPSDLLLHHELCSTGCSSGPRACSCRGFLLTVAFFKLHLPAVLWVLCGATCGNLLRVVHHGLQRNNLFYHGQDSPRLQETSAQLLEHLLPSFCTDDNGWRPISLTFLTCLSQLLLCSRFSQPALLMAQLWPAVDPFQSRPDLALT